MGRSLLCEIATLCGGRRGPGAKAEGFCDFSPWRARLRSLSSHVRAVIASWPTQDLMTPTKEHIKQSWQYGPWNRLDIEAYHFNYHLGDITDWPFDAVEVCCKESEVVFLGCLKAACSLEKWPEYFREKANIVLSMCLQDMAVKGAPKDCTAYFRCHGIQHIAPPLEDIRAQAGGDTAALSLRAKQRAHFHALRWWHQQKRCRNLRMAHPRPRHVSA